LRVDCWELIKEQEKNKKPWVGWPGAVLEGTFKGNIDRNAIFSYTHLKRMNHYSITATRREAMPRVKLGTKRQITLPLETIKRLGMTAGEEFEVVEHDKAVILVPRKHIPKDQQWYYTGEWQKMMQEAFEDVKAGRMIGPFESVEEFKQAVKERARRS